MLPTQKQAFCISRVVGMFSPTALFQQVYTVAWKHGEVRVVTTELPSMTLIKQKKLPRQLINII